MCCGHTNPGLLRKEGSDGTVAFCTRFLSLAHGLHSTADC